MQKAIDELQEQAVIIGEVVEDFRSMDSDVGDQLAAKWMVRQILLVQEATEIYRDM